MVDQPKVDSALELTLAHYGIKGMRWGVRRSQTARKTVPDDEPVTLVRNQKTGGIDAKGGRGHAMSEDAKQAAALRQKAKASGSVALTNQEMKALIDRLNLETNYRKAIANNAPPKTKGEKFIEGGIKFLQGELKVEVNARMQGKQGNLSMGYQAFRAAQKSRTAKKAAKAGAQYAARKVLTGKVVN